MTFTDHFNEPWHSVLPSNIIIYQDSLLKADQNQIIFSMKPNDLIDYDVMLMWPCGNRLKVSGKIRHLRPYRITIRCENKQAQS